MIVIVIEQLVLVVSILSGFRNIIMVTISRLLLGRLLFC